jgi:hypothetical protein
MGVRGGVWVDVRGWMPGTGTVRWLGRLQRMQLTRYDSITKHREAV